MEMMSVIYDSTSGRSGAGKQQGEQPAQNNAHTATKNKHYPHGKGYGFEVKEFERDVFDILNGKNSGCHY